MTDSSSSINPIINSIVLHPPLRDITSSPQQVSSLQRSRTRSEGIHPPCAHPQQTAESASGGIILFCTDPVRRTALIVNSSTCDLTATAQINVLNILRQPVRCRVLLDTRSTTNFIRQGLAVSLNLPLKPFAVHIGALNDTNTSTRYLVRATIRSRISEYERTLDFLTFSVITQAIPDQSLDHKKIRIPVNIILADPDFHCPASVDMLLGSELTLSLLGEGKRKLTPADQLELYFQQTLLGWENVKRDNCGRYIVALLFNGKKALIGESRSRAFCRLKSLERRLDGNAELKGHYHAVIQEYLDLGHPTEVTGRDLSQFGYYLPHHAVINESSTTTKVRAVFDGSSKTNTGVSLNETLHVGPTIQDDIFSLLLRFRLYPYVLTGDIEKMCRQVLVRPEDRLYQRILWHNGKEPVRTFELNTVTFGLSAAPYLAIRCLHQLANDEGHRYPVAAKVLQRDLYVDDLLTGTQTREEAVQLRERLNNLVKLGGFNLRQVNRHLQIGDSTTLKSLGIYWNSAGDTVTYTAKISTNAIITKRFVLSETAKIFDPLGLLSPVVNRPKMITQKIWTLKIGWDTPLPSEVQNEWFQFYDQLHLISKMTFPRLVLQERFREIQLHGFSDASEEAYGACVYLRSGGSNGEVNTALLCAKSRVAPLKRLAIPKLELCGAQLLIKLMQENTSPRVFIISWIRITSHDDALEASSTRKALTLRPSYLHMLNIRGFIHIYSCLLFVFLHMFCIPNNTCHFRVLVFSGLENSNVMEFRGITHQLQTFVSNRVANIQASSEPADWRHVRTHENPTDLVSRGQDIKDFITSNIWFEGPSWLQAEENRWPAMDLQFSRPPSEMKKRFCHVAYSGRQQHPLQWYSSILKLQRVIAVCLRFRMKRKDALAADELITAQQAIIYWLQAEALHSLKRALESTADKGAKNGELAKVSKLSPFLDKDGLIKVGGRLQRAMIPYEQRHPIILPKSHPVTNLIIEEAHVSQLHASHQATLYYIRQQYWPLDGRNSVRRIIHKCNDMHLGNDMHEAQSTSSRLCHGQSTDSQSHGVMPIYKRLCRCFRVPCVKAVHLEVVSDLTTEAFFAALRRFITGRGCCRNILSDNGTNFIGANNALKEIYELFKSEEHQKTLQSWLTTKHIH
ncbi:uncharacterized protein LOC135168143 [Diachasmimorpha longicaudata]|uniref:uncharacterized protein LOC135168143 n=1 Tax=Diachasmimorpha longicaudata TaxID=58733 RepID=UPI0030B8EBB1